MNFKVYYSGKCLNFFICFVLLSKITFMNLGFLLLFSHLSCVWLFVTSWKAAHQASLSFTSPRACSNSWLLSRWCHPNTSPSVTPLFLLSSIFPNIKIFSNESALHIRWPKHWSFSFSISPSNEYSGLISFRMDWFDLLAVQGALKSLLQHHSFEPFFGTQLSFTVQLSHPYMTTGKTIALARQTFVSKVVSLLFNMLASLYIHMIYYTIIKQICVGTTNMHGNME